MTVSRRPHPDHAQSQPPAPPAQGPGAALSRSGKHRQRSGSCPLNPTQWDRGRTGGKDSNRFWTGICKTGFKAEPSTSAAQHHGAAQRVPEVKGSVSLGQRQHPLPTWVNEA